MLTIKISYFQFFRYVKISRSTIYPTLTNFSVLPFLPLLQLLECRNGKSVHGWPQLHNKVSTHYYTGLNGLVNSFYYFTIALPMKLILGCKPHSSAKMNKNKNNIMREVAARCSTKKASLNITQNSQKKCARVSF